MRRALLVMIAALLMTLTWNGPASAATYYLWQQDFTTDTTDWQGPVAHNATDGTATAGQGAFSKFGEYRSEFPGDYVAELDVYLDPTWTAGQGFEYTVASSKSSGGHLRDFGFHIASTVNGLRVNGDNNVYGAGGNVFIAAQGTQITEEGWYTMQHTFRDDNGVLAVDLTLLDSDDQVSQHSLAGTSRAGTVATQNNARSSADPVTLFADRHETWPDDDAPLRIPAASGNAPATGRRWLQARVQHRGSRPFLGGRASRRI